MTFLNPLGFFGLVSIPVIILLHLYRERRKRLIVPNLDLWSFLQVEVKGPKPRRLPITLILILQVLIALLFTLAWTQPEILLVRPTKAATHYILLVDISLSMSATDVVPSRFSQAVVSAGGLLRSVKQDDSVTIITFGRSPELVGELSQANLQSLMDILSNLKPVDRGSDIEAALALGLSITKGTLPVEFHIFTDGASPAPNLEYFPHPLHFWFFGNDDNNQAVISVIPYTDNNGVTHVLNRIANYSRQDRLQSVVLYFDGDPVDSASVSIPAQSTLVQTWKVSGQPTLVTVALAFPDNAYFDDQYSVGMIQEDKVSVLVVADDPGPIAQAVKSVPEATLRTLLPSDYSPHNHADLTIFRQFIPERPPRGMTLLVDPPLRSNGNSTWAPLIKDKQEIPILNAHPVLIKDPLLLNLELNNISWKNIWSPDSVPDGYEPMIHVSGHPLLLRSRQENVTVLVLLDDLTSGNFTSHPAFPLFFSNLIRSTREKYVSSSLLTGEPIWLPSSNAFRSLVLTLPDGKDQRLSGDWPAFWFDTTTPGPYHIQAEDPEGRIFTFLTGVNAYDPEESNIQKQLWVTDKQSTSIRSSEGSKQPVELLPWLLVSALFLLFFEAFLAWR
jgi:Ca-activated chloride channel homolog